MKNWFCGAGASKLQFPASIFPTPGEHYDGVHDAPEAHVILLRAGEDAGSLLVFVHLDLVAYADYPHLKDLVAARTGADKNFILVICNHDLSTPHDVGHGAEGEAYRSALHGCVERAVLESLESAISDMEPCDLTFAMGCSHVNVSRVRPAFGGLWQGTNERGYSDHTIPILRLRSRKDGQCLALLYVLNMAPGVLENSRSADGRRYISADLAGAVPKYLKEDAVCCYCIGAPGDQWQALRAVTEMVQEDHTVVEEDLHETGYLYVDALARKIASAIHEATEGPAEPVLMKRIRRAFAYPGQEVQGESISEMKPGAVAYHRTKEVKSDLTLVRLGEVVLVLAGPEIDAASLAVLRQQTGCEKLVYLAFADGADGYMAKKENYEGCGYQSRKSRFYAGSAELFEQNAVELVKEILQ